MSNKRLEKGDGPGISNEKRGPIMPSRPAFEGRPNPSQAKLREYAVSLDMAVEAVEILATQFLAEAEAVRKASVSFSESKFNGGRRNQNDEIAAAPSRVAMALEVAVQRAMTAVRGGRQRDPVKLAERYGG